MGFEGLHDSYFTSLYTAPYVHVSQSFDQYCFLHFCSGFSLEDFQMAGLLIIRGEKSEISRDLKRQIRGENGRFRGIFAGIFGPNFR